LFGGGGGSRTFASLLEGMLVMSSISFNPNGFYDAVEDCILSENGAYSLPSGHSLVTKYVSWHDDIEQAIKDSSRSCASACYSISLNTISIDDTYHKLSVFCESQGIKAPKPSILISTEGAVKRLLNASWWESHIRKVYVRLAESNELSCNAVNLRSSIYLSFPALTYFKERRQRNREMLEKMIAENELGEQVFLSDLADSSVSNPVNRRNELMCRLAGFEAYADKHNHIAVFLTLTCPSRMHASLNSSGRSNPKYDGISPKEANDYLVDVFARVRAKLERDGIIRYGFRVAEPHHDATPHWHLLLWGTPEDIKSLIDVFRDYYLQDSPNEKGAEKYRVKVEYIDKTKGSAVGYIAKYISKNIDGHGIDADLYGENASSSSERIGAWASIWGIRQFQQVGGPSVEVWRELRKIQKLPANCDAIKQQWLAADSGDWCAFIESMGGINCLRKNSPVTVSRIWNDKLNAFGDPVGWLVDGLHTSGLFIKTRFHEWTLKGTYISDSLCSKVSAGRDASYASAHPSTYFAPWSSVNNCTVSDLTLPLRLTPI